MGKYINQRVISERCRMMACVCSRRRCCASYTKRSNKIMVGVPDKQQKWTAAGGLTSTLLASSHSRTIDPSSGALHTPAPGRPMDPASRSAWPRRTDHSSVGENALENIRISLIYVRSGQALLFDMTTRIEHRLGLHLTQSHRHNAFRARCQCLPII